MYCPEIFKDGDLELKRRIITYLSGAHRYKFLDVGRAVRIVCPDLYTTYHYNFDTCYLQQLTNKEGKKLYTSPPMKADGFLGALCSYILPLHSPSIVYNVCKIPFLMYEKEKKNNA